MLFKYLRLIIQERRICCLFNKKNHNEVFSLLFTYVLIFKNIFILTALKSQDTAAIKLSVRNIRAVLARMFASKGLYLHSQALSSCYRHSHKPYLLLLTIKIRKFYIKAGD